MDIDIDQVLSLVSHTADFTIVDSANIPVSYTHQRLMKQNSLLAPREIYLKSIDFAWDHMRGILEHGQTDVANMFTKAVDGSPWVWSVLPELRFNSVIDKVQPLTTNLAARGMDNVSALANGVIAGMLREFGCTSLAESSATSIEKINETLDALYSIIASPETDLSKSMQSALFTTVCSIPLGEYGIIFGMISLFQVVWRRLLEYSQCIQSRGQQYQRYKRLIENFSGNASGARMLENAVALMKASPTSKGFVSAVLLQIWLGTANLEDLTLDSGATIEKFNLIGAAVCEFIKAPTRVEDLAKQFSKYDVLELDLDIAKFGDIITALQLNNIDITSVINSAMNAGQ